MNGPGELADMKISTPLKLTHLLEFAAFETVALFLQLLPLKGMQAAGRVLGRFFFGVVRHRRDVTLENLRRAFPEKSEEERLAIARGAYESIGTTLCELLWVPRFTPESIRKLICFEHPEIIREAHARGKGILVLTAHFGNWELLGQGVLAHFGHRVCGIAKTQTNRLVNRAIDRRRELFGNKVIPMETALREVLKALRDGEFIGIVADQAAPKENVQMEFFGTMVPTHQGPSVFCLKTGAAILAMFAVRQSDGTYVVSVEEVPSADLDGSSEENINELTRRHVKVTENAIRSHPEQWLWQHKRWKHTPPAPESSERR